MAAWLLCRSSRTTALRAESAGLGSACPRNVSTSAYPPVMSTDFQRPYRVTVTLARMAGEDALLPPGAHARAEAVAAAVAANDLMTAWTSDRALLSMMIESPSQAGALAAGRAVARA